MTSQRQLVTYDESTLVTKQHTRPCGDCPWRRSSLAGWLGGASPEDWVGAAHGDAAIACHTRRFKDGGFIHCAGAAIYRANVSKKVRPDALRALCILPLELAKDVVKVFTTPLEFLAHHKSTPKTNKKE
jgi:hypothetical protein